LNHEVSDALRIIHWRIAWGQFRAAPKARTETRVLCLLRTIVKAAIDFLRWLHGTNGSAINASRCHAHKKKAVETEIAGDERFVK